MNKNFLEFIGSLDNNLKRLNISNKFLVKLWYACFSTNNFVNWSECGYKIIIDRKENINPLFNIQKNTVFRQLLFYSFKKVGRINKKSVYYNENFNKHDINQLLFIERKTYCILD